MSGRDTELDAVMRALQRNEPYLHEPDEKNVDVGGACFLNRDRVCGPDCTAFVSPDAPTAVERCVLLSAAQQVPEFIGELMRERRADPYCPPNITPPHVEPPKRHGGSR